MAMIAVPSAEVASRWYASHADASHCAGSARRCRSQTAAAPCPQGSVQKLEPWLGLAWLRPSTRAADLVTRTPTWADLDTYALLVNQIALQRHQCVQQGGSSVGRGGQPQPEGPDPSCLDLKGETCVSGDAGPETPHRSLQKVGSVCPRSRLARANPGWSCWYLHIERAEAWQLWRIRSEATGGRFR